VARSYGRHDLEPRTIDQVVSVIRVAIHRRASERRDRLLGADILCKDSVQRIDQFDVFRSNGRLPTD
jgi:hypothetical protein